MKASIAEIHPEVDLAVLQFTLLQNVDLSCVYLEQKINPGDNLYLFGYPDQDYPDGCPVTLSCEGLAGDRLIKFKLGQVRPGMSGSPLLNVHTGKVCGIVKSTRNCSSDLGGGAISTETILQYLPYLIDLQQKYHQQDRRWSNLINPVSQAISRGLSSSALPVPSTLTDRHRCKLKEELNSFQNEYELLHKKLSSLRKGRVIKTDVAVKFKLDSQIKETELYMEEAKQRLEQIESKLN